MAKPKFQHNCENCEFLGHYFKHDVYVCKHQTGLSFLARYDNEPSNYASFPSCVFAPQLDDDYEGKIGSVGQNDYTWVMHYHDYLFSDKCCRSTAAITLALANIGIKAIQEQPCIQ